LHRQNLTQLIRSRKCQESLSRLKTCLPRKYQLLVFFLLNGTPSQLGILLGRRVECMRVITYTHNIENTCLNTTLHF